MTHDPYDLRTYNGPDEKRAFKLTEEDAPAKKKAKPKRKNPAKASPARMAEIRAKKCGQCRVCDTKDGLIHAHHIIRQGTDLWLSSDTENNIVGLCAQCHTDLHAGRDKVKKILRARLSTDEVRHTDKNAYKGYVDDIYWPLRKKGRNPGTLQQDAA